MNQKKVFFLTLGILAAVEILSLVGYAVPAVTAISAGVVLLAAMILTIRNTAWGFIILLVELLVGSQGYLLYIDIGNDKLPLRIGLWIIVMAIWLVTARRDLQMHLKRFRYLWPLLLLILAISIGAINGYFQGNDVMLIITEAKRWVYLITIVPLLLIFEKSENRRYLWPTLMAAGAWIIIKTLLVLYIFSHDFGLTQFIYSWTRSNLLGEITTLPNGFSRVFLQSQIFAVAGFLIAAALFITDILKTGWKFKQHHYWHGIAAAAFLSVIITSLSRSFWVGTAAAVVVMIILGLLVCRPSWQKIWQSILGLAAISAGSLAILGIIIVIPFPKPLWALDVTVLSNRATEFEAGAASRWALLPVMATAIREQPVVGSGLGATLTYLTSDPRVRLSSVNGSYTTNAFEWGWLDIWLKLGLLGLIAYGWLIARGLKQGFQARFEAPGATLAVIGGFIALVVAHFFTPYLNHPLGFGYLAIILLLAERRALTLD